MASAVFTHANLIDCTGADPRPDSWVAVEGNRIKEVGQGSPGALPSLARGIDAGWGREVAEGAVPGPRLSVCGTYLSQTGGHGDKRLSTATC
jgi:imidazolonepropionase-like amidohydrolase